MLRNPRVLRRPRVPSEPRALRRPRRRTPLLLAAALVTLSSLSGTALGGGSARADDPAPPSAARVQAAQDAASARAAQVTAVQAQLAAAQQAERDLDIKAEQAVEAYNGAQVRQQQADTRSTQAAAEAASAAVRREAARQAAADLAVAQYRLGVPSGLALVQGLMRVQNLRAAGIQEQGLHAVEDQAKSIVDEATSTAAEAATASAAADQAAIAARTAAAAVQQAELRVRAQLAAQHAEVVRIDAQHTVLLAQLAAAQQISVTLAAQRQQALAAAAAKAAAEAAAAAARQSAGGDPDGGDGGGSTPYRPGDASAAVAFARAQLGLPYVWGGAGPDVFDCSGLTMRAWQHAGVDLPHFAADQYARSTPLSYHQLSPGDLVFWSHNGTPQDIYHVAIYLGDDQMIEAPRTGDVVKIASLWIMGTPNFYARPN